MVHHLKMHTHSHAHCLRDTRKNGDGKSSCWISLLKIEYTVDEKITANIIFQMICLHSALIRIFAHVLCEVNSLALSLYGRNRKNFAKVEKWWESSGNDNDGVDDDDDDDVDDGSGSGGNGKWQEMNYMTFGVLKTKRREISLNLWVTTGNALFHTILNTMKRIENWFISHSLLHTQTPSFSLKCFFFLYAHGRFIHIYYINKWIDGW